MPVDNILRAGLANARGVGMELVRARHLSASQLDELLLLSAEHLWERRTGPSDEGEGWQRSNGGIRPWWQQVADLDEEETRRVFRRLRQEVYDLLEDRGCIKKNGRAFPLHVAPPETWQTCTSPEVVITVAADRAGYGDPASNAAVEAAAMKHVIDAYEKDGWVCDNVSEKNLGWDVTVTRGGHEWHLEVKGVSGSKPSCLLTRNEHDTADRDPSWRLSVVVLALTSPTLYEFDAERAVAASEPYVYKVDLT